MFSKCSALYVYDTSRPCPTFRCPSSASSPGPCTTAPPEVIDPGYTVGIGGCTLWQYTGPRCSTCGQNYCTRELLRGEESVGICPYGFLSTTMGYNCALPPPPVRCTGPSSACPTTGPTRTPYEDPSTVIYSSSCQMTVWTGRPCEPGCAQLCTIPGQIDATVGDSPQSCEGEEYRTTTTDMACPNKWCELRIFPTPCTHETPTTGTVVETWGCDVYVQTGRSCRECPQVCTSTK